MTQIFNNNITGAVQNLANGSHDFSQNSSTGMRIEDITALVNLLRVQGLSENDLTSLAHAIKSDKEDGVGVKVKNWMGDLASRAATGAVSVGLDRVTTIIIPAIKSYLGIS